MKKHLLFVVSFLLACISCEQAAPPNKIFITGDYSGSLDYLWEEESSANNLQIRAASYPDSSSISYPSFYFIISPDRAILYVRTDENSALDYYYAIRPVFQYSGQELQVKELKMIFGTGLVNDTIQNPDDTRSVLLDGKLKRP
ncbi:MAG: hypothetical protein KatS3mg033_0865 [Thermonema sp.]|uniref:hypothetical protein n=1 Tax=Thermonema sp. TaxID=2231181 RepID=UPI0021DDD2C7|nr:hypothetical protein [Thermonema sp.]GIV39065.1 MAG: hypothetical protein KatS3mg033_0865 [Thermonema sp.]